MAYNKDNDYDDFEEYFEDEDYFDEDYEEKSNIIYGGGAVRHRNDDVDSHYTKRDPSRKHAREQAMAERRAELSPKKCAVNRASPNSSVWTDIVKRAGSAFAGVTPASRRSTKGKSKARRQSMIIGIVGIIMSVVVLSTFGLMYAYRSNSIFSDGKLDDNAIQERLITDEANKDKVTYFLIVGVDKSSMLTDCIWLMCFDNAAHKMNVMQIPRDTYVGKDSLYPHKINAVYANPKTVDWCDRCNIAVTEEEIYNGTHTVCGSEVSEKTESNISALIRCINTRLGMPVDHYVLFDFKGFEKIIDAMGGVDIYLEEDTKVYPNKHEYEVLPAGNNHLDGKMALKFMRNRQIYLDGDLGRVKAQRSIIHAMMDKASDMSVLKMLSILRAAYGNFNTDMSLEEIRSFIAPFKKCSDESLNMFTMPGIDHWVKPNPSYYVCYPEQTVEAINEYMIPYGEKITEEDINFPILYD